MRIDNFAFAEGETARAVIAVDGLLLVAQQDRGSLVQHHADLDPRVRARLRQVLLDAASDPAAAIPLRRFFGTTGFTAMGETDAAALEVLGEAARRTREAIE